MLNYQELYDKVNLCIDNMQYNAQPEGLYAPIKYVLDLGGKRIRPVLMLMAYNLYKDRVEDILPNAIALETYHNFTLLHDDLMDKSPIRRGQPTVYRKWDENTAILSGDTMFALAWRYFLVQPHARLQEILNCFNETAILVCEGQQYDMNFERRDDITIPEYMMMIRHKTAVLLAGALKIGALYANAPEQDIDHIYEFGIHLGLAFQLQDDLFDSFGNVAEFGKQTGQDIRDNKKTYLFLSALQSAPADLRRELVDLFASTPQNSDAKVERVLQIYRQLDIRHQVEEAIAKEFRDAVQHLDSINTEETLKKPLRELTTTLFGRKN